MTHKTHLIAALLAGMTIASSSAHAQTGPVGPAQEVSFEAIDVDRNFVLDPAEFEAAFRTPGDYFAYLDLNADGFITKHEARVAYEDYAARQTGTCEPLQVRH
jgi:hypothetical protein